MLTAAEIRGVAVYPPLGIARVGNAAGEDDFFLASEVAGQPPRPSSGMRDATGALKRQAVLFRIYAELHTGEIRELTAADGVSIEWRVEVANLKAGWYQFNQAMDLPDGLAKVAERRNRSVTDRNELDIRPAKRRVAGASQRGAPLVFDDGAFHGRPVTLGEIRTDAEGRLIFLGGMGSSAPRVAGTKPTTFANNDGWHDDVCDGPVRATVAVGQVKLEATPGYVVVAPPNFAPGLFGLVTMDDVVREVFFAQGFMQRPTATSFARDVWPIFQRLTGLQWVNHGLFVLHGAGSPLDANSDAVLTQLRDGSASNQGFRARVLALFRRPIGQAGAGLVPLRAPEIYGDAFGENDDIGTARLAVTQGMYEHLERWAAGTFSDDWSGVPPERRFEDLSATQQIAELDRAGLYECLGGPFHPGIELSWPMRARSIWHGRYRLRVLPEGQAVRQDYGDTLTPAQCLNETDGPLVGVGPGSLTRWMGVPWQTDEASCNSAADYEPSTFLSMPSYWGARVPDQVLSVEAWERAAAEVNGNLQRLKHFGLRSDWLRDVRGRGYIERITQMVGEWWTLGIITQVETPPALRALGLPPQAHVEMGRQFENAGSDPKRQLVAAIEGISLPTTTLGAGGPHVPPRRRYGRGEV
jgi:hypothetical protein